MGPARCLCGLILLLLHLHLLGAVFLGSVLADQIYTGSAHFSHILVKYTIWRVLTIVLKNTALCCGLGDLTEIGQEEVAMSNKEGKNYNCYLPIVEETKVLKTVTQENSSSLIMESEQKIKFKTPDELIEGLKDRCFYRYEGWWTYEFCSHKHVKQLHIEDHKGDNKVVQEFVLGMFDADATSVLNENHSDIFTVKDPRSKDASQRFHAHQYTNGTMCDLTNQPRETEVRFVCSEQSVVISSIKEAATCKYVVTIQCSLLCKHPMFQQETPMGHTIHCNEKGGNSKDSMEDGLKATKAPT
ncbi:protein OS-9 homolog [Curcuma longa]|uniref:protein OS-9 homolog n=1 Tax=Curcuma longa TaxID=136217 RepID=UPI003D9DFF43